MRRWGSHDLARAVLVALAVGAGTAGFATAMAEPLGSSASSPITPERVHTSAGSDSVAPAAKETPTTAGASSSAVAPSASSEPSVLPSSIPTSVPATASPSPSITSSAHPTTTVAPPKADRSGSASQDVLTITNNERGKAGCPALTLDDRLTKAATDHSVDMARNNYFSHTSQDGRTFVERAKAAGYPNPGAENIAKGQSTPEAVMDAWMKSAGHRENILNCGLKTMGLGLATDGYYWTQLFGR